MYKRICPTCASTTNVLSNERTEDEIKVCHNCERKTDPNYIYENEGRLLRDGIYGLTDIVVIHFDAHTVGDCNNAEKHKDNEEIVNFKTIFPNYCVAQAYQAETIFFLSSRPKDISKCLVAGRGFNYGSCNMLSGCPSRILILAEDD